MTTETHVFFLVLEFGDDVAAVTAALGVEPSEAWLRGDRIAPHPSARQTHSRWQLDSGLPPHGCFEDQLNALLDRLEQRTEGVRHVASRFDAGVRAAIYTSEVNPEWCVSPRAVRRLAALGLGIEFDVYRLPGDA
ncbi:MAG: DUF4279 domain-containing protein [Planctomycetes bacterium]|nr:DUF4279 domain-containing protein [Planctomycetota bacterium]MCB9871648.1 DUF4279 domain-containing protein [Planctomycetota bacterium]